MCRAFNSGNARCANCAWPFDEDAPGFEQTILDLLPGMPEFVAADPMDLEIKANWKIVLDGFSEGYRIPIAHPALSKLHGGRSKAANAGERYTFYHGTGRTTHDGFEVKPGEPCLSWKLWPNHCLLSLPGSPLSMDTRVQSVSSTSIMPERAMRAM